ncbi:class A beta-lactamase [Luteimonas sp. M1R5S18]|uniref:beta-lactamase n=1 Tax=Luteimonas rhizosphaericola TaxID=3042024 RepID=A0ABT6JGS2_9GAMM|nr:class A beta-lactamase [Luteimonas rhizosphaericola]MDH5829246.1 class A beta-lactamase [Luteimonas rhizosphaericola]
MIGRRSFMLGTIAALCAPAFTRAGAATQTDPVAQLQALERMAGGRLGAFVLDTGTGKGIGLRSDERFCHCSTFKLSLAALALHEADAGRIDLDEPLAFARADLMFHSPVLEANLDQGALPVVALAEAIQVTSDNGAANVLMRRLGGPEALTRFWRGLGDPVSRIDGYEPEINVIPPGTEENSTTPRAMAHTLQRIVLGDVLAGGSRERLQKWMDATRTGLRRIRAGLPPGWRGLDKTGTGMRPGEGNKTNDVAVLFPPGGRAPLVVAGYFEHPEYSESIRPADEAVLAGVGEVGAAWVG